MALQERGDTRTKRSIRNMTWAFGGQFLQVVFVFVCRTVFIHELGAAYLGITGLFGNILSLLSLADLGVGNAIAYSLYKPLAEKDEPKIAGLVNFFAACYRVVWVAVLVLGLAILPLVNRLVEQRSAVPHLTVIYLLLLFNSALSYTFAHKSTLLAADQRQYVLTKYGTIFSAVQSILQTVILLVTHQFILYLCVQIGCTFLNNYCAARQADRRYPFLKTEQKRIDTASRNSIYKNMGALSLHKLADVGVYYTENILIAFFAGIEWVGFYSNYTMILNTIKRFTELIHSSVKAGIGQLNAQESKEHAYAVFQSCFLLSFWLNGSCVICLWVLLEPFICLWIGKSYLLSRAILALILVVYYLVSMRAVVILYKDSSGLFWHDRFNGLIEAAIYLSAAVFLGLRLGIGGVFIGRLVSLLTTCWWVEPYILFKYGFCKPVWLYFVKYALYTCGLGLALWLTGEAAAAFSAFSVAGFAGRLLACLVIPNVLFVAGVCRTAEWRYLWDRVRQLRAARRAAKRRLHNPSCC